MPDYRDKQIVETYQKGSPHLLPPHDRVEEFQARRRANSRDSYQHSRTRSPAYDDYGLKPAKSVSPTAAATVGTAVGNAVARRRHSMSPDKGQLQRRYHYESDSDSDSDSDTSSRRSHQRKKDSKGLRHAPCSDKCNDNPKEPKEEDLSDYSSSEEAKQKKDRRKNIALTAGLASITTIAAANGLYQNTKAYHARKNAVKQGEMCSHEEQKLRNKGLAMDLFSAGVIAVSANNVRLGWQRYQNAKKLSKEQEERAIRKKEKRRAESWDRRDDYDYDYDYRRGDDYRRDDDYRRR
ncbi:MAG: hypothetical protein HETSPECPRED_002202 [Heterodermia speciosa]|uniref:Uncharacterized protein n=1 Tax=Heterodermia speciosa TaxID=116794 RepID=A0A8H3PH52_9LECA|nr:MAG: hypothetical protein HETSPECPRED_002202 [Heterodermia speciosa]